MALMLAIVPPVSSGESSSKSRAAVGREALSLYLAPLILSKHPIGKSRESKKRLSGVSLQ